MEWIAYCTTCGELDRGPNGTWMEATARVHRRDTGHMTMIGYEPAIVMSGEMVEAPLTPSLGLASHTGAREVRPFPQTYGDWVNLAEDIKAKYYFDDPASRAAVNYQLRYIGEETEYPTEAREAKRWLVEKAGELGIT